MENKNVYIMSLEGAEIWEHLNRERELKKNYIGMIPFSLNLSKLKKIGLKTFDSKTYNKILSNDIINITFKSKVLNIVELVKKKQKNLNEMRKQLDVTFDEEDRKKLKKAIEKQKEYIKELKENPDYNLFADLLRNENKLKILKDEINIEPDEENKKNIEDLISKTEDGIVKVKDKIKDFDKWTDYSNDQLREFLYNNEFTLAVKEGKTIRNITYIVYCRSSSKSRSGQILFINKKLKDKIIKWQRLGMNLEGRTDIDYPSLLSYETLVCSAIEDVFVLNPNNILIVPDVKSVFPIDCNVVEKDENGKLVSKIVKDYIMENELFDGEGILESDYFDRIGRSDKSFILARQHMFKSCLFRGNIQQFLMDYAESNNIDYNTWELTNAFNEKMLAKDVHCIITPSSAKFLKFSHVKGSNPRMWNHWKKKVLEDDCVFGICKSDKESQRGTDDKGNIVNQLSYQMIGSMPINYNDMLELSQFEIDYISKLKNDNKTYIEYLKNNSNNLNSNDMLVDLYKLNDGIASTMLFKNKRKKDINNYIKHIKKGKPRVISDYCTIFQNGKEYLYHAVAKLPVNDGILNYGAWKHEMILNDNECYCKLYPQNGSEYVAFRNPHTAPSNCLILRNIESEFIDSYFLLGKNTIYTNVINFPINRILSGQDADSDSLLLVDNNVILKNAHKCYIKSPDSKHRVCVNSLNRQSNKYTVCNADMAKIDNILATSQFNIGRVVNLGAEFMAHYYNMLNKGGEDTNKLDEAMKAIDICTILSEIAIDSAKKMTDIDIGEQILYLSESDILTKEKPLFFEHVSQNNKIKNRLIEFKTSMDYLQKIFDEEIDDANSIKTVPLENFLLELDCKAKSRQVNSIINLISKITKKIKSVECKYNNGNKYDKDEDQKKKYREIEYIKNKNMPALKKYRIKQDTILTIIYKLINNEIKSGVGMTDIFNALHQTDKEVFLSAFKRKS